MTKPSYPYFKEWHRKQTDDTRRAMTWLLKRGKHTSNPLLKDLYNRVTEFLDRDRTGDLPDFPSPLSPKQVHWLTNTHIAWLRVRHEDDQALLDSTKGE